MTVRSALFCSAGSILLLLCALAMSLPVSFAQPPGTFNEYQVKSNDDPKSDIWTMDFVFKAPRVMKVNVPARGTRVCWYMWFQVINRTKEPRTIYPEFELVTYDFPAVYYDETLTTVEDAIRKIEDPTGYQEIRSTAKFFASPIPVSLPADKAFPKAITGVAIWDGSPAKVNGRDEKSHDIGDSQQFSVFVTGLSNGTVTVDPLTKGKLDQPIVRRKTLKLNFKRAGDRFNLDSRDIQFQPPAEWEYRSTRLPKLKGPDQTAPPARDGKNGAFLSPALDLQYNIEPAIYRGSIHGS